MAEVNADDLGAIGLATEEIDKLRAMVGTGMGAGQGGGEVAILPVNVQAVDVFLALETQWRRGPLGHRIGLDHAAILPTLELMGVKKKQRPELFWKLKTMEGAALEELMQ